MKTVICCICGKEVPEYDAESTTVFGGKIQYRCIDCAERGRKNAIAHKCAYFDYTYEGKERHKNYRKKIKQKG